MRKAITTLIIAATSAIAYMAADGALAVVHPKVGNQVTADDGKLTITLTDKRQNHNWSDRATREEDIFSPKSVRVHPDGTKYYVNSLEGGMTVVFSTDGNRKLTTIHHQFAAADSALWALPSGYYPIRFHREGFNTFMGKPVESCFSHNGRFLWVPYYRRSFDINAQLPSAVAIIDTRTDSIVRLMETGPLPKMIASSPDGRYVAITHWGDNTVGIVDVSAPNARFWRHKPPLIVDYKLTLNLPTGTEVNRDRNSGYCLRGTVFTPDSHYLLVSCMGGDGIAAIDVKAHRYLGRVTGMRGNVRHLIIHGGYLYLSSNNQGYVQRLPLDKFLAALPADGHTSRVDGWQECKVGAGARTIEITPDGRYILAACNAANSLDVVEVATMRRIASVPADSYPVGLDIAPDGHTAYLTSQARNYHGGNNVGIFRLDYDK